MLSAQNPLKTKLKKIKALLDAGSFHIVYNEERLKETIFGVIVKIPQDEDRYVSKVLNITQKVCSFHKICRSY